MASNRWRGRTGIGINCRHQQGDGLAKAARAGALLPLLDTTMSNWRLRASAVRLRAAAAKAMAPSAPLPADDIREEEENGERPNTPKKRGHKVTPSVGSMPTPGS